MVGLVMKLKSSYFWTSLKIGKYTRRRTRGKNGEFEPRSKRYYEETYRDGTYLELAAMAAAKTASGRASRKGQAAVPTSPYWSPRPYSHCGAYGFALSAPAAVIRRSKTTVTNKKIVRSSEQYNAV